MSRSGEIVRFFAGDERTFRFDLGAHDRLQAALDDRVGVSLIVQKLASFVLAWRSGMTVEEIAASRFLGDVRLREVREVIFQGLVSAGMEPPAAGKLCELWVFQRPLSETAPLAYDIGLAALDGPADERAAGEQQGAAAEPHSPTAASASAKTASTPSAARRATRRKTSKA